MVTAAERLKDPKLRVKYDRTVDVLHIHVGAPVASEGDGRQGGIELDYSVENGRPCGAKVIGFTRYGWSNNLGELARIVGNHLSIGTEEVVDAIKEALRSFGRKP